MSGRYLVPIARSMLVAAGVMFMPPLAPEASAITRTFVITASGFDVGAPVASVSGQFAVTWDNSADVGTTTTGISGSISQLSLASALSFTYVAGSDIMLIGGDSPFTVGPHTNDYSIRIDNASASPSLGSFVYSTTVYDTTAASTSGSVTLANELPEPASLALLAGAVGGVGLVRRRNRRAA